MPRLAMLMPRPPTATGTYENRSPSSPETATVTAAPATVRRIPHLTAAERTLSRRAAGTGGDPVRQLLRLRSPEVAARIVEAVRQCGEKAVDQHQPDICLYPPAALHPKVEASVILFGRGKKRSTAMSDLREVGYSQRLLAS